MLDMQGAFRDFGMEPLNAGVSGTENQISGFLLFRL